MCKGKGVPVPATMSRYEGAFKGGGSSIEIFRFVLKCEGKEVERKRKKGCGGGGGLPLNIFWELIFFREGLRFFGRG